jgi:hypothetical protein
VEQVTSVAVEYTRLPVPSADRVQWTHVLGFEGPLRGDVHGLLNLLMTVVTIPSPSPASPVLALDFYKIADPRVDPHEWRNTEVGALVHEGKYWRQYNVARRRQAGKALVDQVVRAVRCHPLLGTTTAVVDVPGHDARQISFGSQMAASVAHRLGLRFVRTCSRAEFRPPAKDAIDERVRMEAIRGQFRTSADLTRQSVLVVDDVIRSGLSLAEAARAATAAGAERVWGIAGARTMKR